MPTVLLGSPGRPAPVVVYRVQVETRRRVAQGQLGQERLECSLSANMFSSGHAAADASIVRMARAGAVVGDEQLARISVECSKRHPGRCEEARADGHIAPRRGCGRSAGEPGEDPLLGVVERFVSHFLLQLAVYGTDVDA